MDSDLIPFHKKYDVNVGWVEERNPTPKDLGIVGFHAVEPTYTSVSFFSGIGISNYEVNSSLIPIHENSDTYRFLVGV